MINKIELILNYLNSQKFEEAKKLALSEIENFPEQAFFLKVLGYIYKKQNKYQDSLYYIRKAINISPDDPELFNNLGNTLRELKNFKDAKISYNQAIKLNQNYSDAYYNLAILYEELNNLEKAEFYYNFAISLNPNLAQAYNNLGNILIKQKKFVKAEYNYNKAIYLNPGLAETYNNLGNLLEKNYRLNEAEKIFKKFISLKPNSPEGYNNLGNIFAKNHKFEEAEKHYNQAILLNPKFTQAYYNLGIMFYNLKKFDEAIVALKKILPSDNNFISAQSQLIHIEKEMCNFNYIKKMAIEIKNIGIRTGCIEPFFSLSWDDNPKLQLIRTKNFVKQNYNNINIYKKRNIYPDKIRIGYFSSDFYNFPTMHLLVKLLELHDRKRFEIFVFSYGHQINDDMNTRIKKSVDHFFDISNLSTIEILKLTRNKKIDISIDLNGYTKNRRTDLFEQKISPIQINYLGYPGTMSADFMDYIVADNVLIPFEKRKFYSEKIIFMPNTYQPNDNSKKIELTKTTRSDHNLPEDSFILCCFNQNYKIGIDEFNIWMRLLKKIKGSVLWLIKSNKWAMENLINEAKDFGIESSRIIFAEKITYAKHIARHKHADLFIDTFFYNAHTTASDALWSGLPVVTKLGQQFSARVAASLLNAIGLPELITKSNDEYENLIFYLANNPKKLKDIKLKLYKNIKTEPLFNTELYTKNFEKGLLEIFNIYYNDKSFKDIIINDL